MKPKEKAKTTATRRKPKQKTQKNQSVQGFKPRPKSSHSIARSAAKPTSRKVSVKRVKDDSSVTTTAPVKIAGNKNISTKGPYKKIASEGKTQAKQRNQKKTHSKFGPWGKPFRIRFRWMKAKHRCNTMSKAKKNLIILGLGLLLYSLSSLFLPPGFSRLLISGNLSIYKNMPVLLNQDPVKVHIIDVDQGDASLLQVEDQYILIDSGNPKTAHRVVSYLKGLGVGQLEALILTHAHDDHLGAANEILQDFKVEHLFMSPNIHKHPLLTNALAIAKARNIPVTTPIRGLSLQLGSAQLDCYHPKPGSYDNINNESSVWTLTYGAHDLLFLADLELDAAGELPHGPFTFVRAGHHGSNSSYSEKLDAWLSPQMVAISVGENDYGHPSKSVLDLLSKNNRKILRTDQSGTMVFSFDKTRMTLPTSLPFPSPWP